MDLKKLNNKQILQAWKKVFKPHYLMHCLGPSVAWHADTDKERVTKALVKMIDDQTKKKKLNLVASEIFSSLVQFSELNRPFRCRDG